MRNGAELNVQLWKHEWKSKAQGISGRKLHDGRQTGCISERQATQNMAYLAPLKPAVNYPLGIELNHFFEVHHMLAILKKILVKWTYYQ